MQLRPNFLPVDAVIEGVMNRARATPLLIQEGRLRIKKTMRSHRSGADGVVGIDEGSILDHY